jgi:transcription-repair coupling factor (superfamily II helicase)
MLNANLFCPPLPSTTNEYFVWKNLYGASTSLVLNQTLKNSQRPILILASSTLAATRLIDELQFFHTESNPCLLPFPDWETLPYDHFSPHQDIVSERLATLSRLPCFLEGAIITTIATLMHCLPPQDYLTTHSFLLKIGDKLNIDMLRTRLTKAGYRSVIQVREHGEYAIRGSIVDLFPMGSTAPFRIDLLDNEVDTIRTFSPETQRTLEKIPNIHLLPAKEFPLTEEAIDLFRQAWRSQFTGNPLKCPIYQDISEGICPPGIEYYLPLFFQQTATLFEYLPKNTLIVTFGNTLETANEFWHEAVQRYEQNCHDISRPLLTPQQIFISPQTLQEKLKLYSRILVNTDNIKKVVKFNTTPAPALEINHKASQPLTPLQRFVSQYKGRILFCVETVGRREVILQLFRTIALHPTYFTSWQAFLDSHAQHGIVIAPIDEGFSLENPLLTFITETQLYGKRVMQRRLRKKTAQDVDSLIRDLTELQINDPIVHVDHGVGRYRGLQTLKVGQQITEFLCLEYANEDKLYVPVASLHLVARYTGTDTEHTPLHKLGNEQWQKAKRKATKQIRDVAVELLDLYARRAAQSGFAYQVYTEQCTAFSAGFPFEETPDQSQAIDQVFADMAANKPMDRVICGDVGFGKTEVAMRAAFLAIQNNKQVAVLVPTTLLAQQHYQNFQDRFADWPIQIDTLSRFKTGKQQANVLQNLVDGKIDIIIGTHKLLQSDVKFKSLGLLIIDEEHRFGVKQKESFKSLRAVVDILTLTATPIPRTLNMALSGIRDLSVIATPPAHRLSVKTFVHDYQDHIVIEAIQREIMRGGQVYFLHNEIATINRKAEELSKLVKEARIGIAHGQMHERELERVMSEFYHRYFNVLVCSTIIESGIDIPTANTIIINRADKFGLAQLHQLRGRVGRSHHQAYAYLLIPSYRSLTSEAKKRLDAIGSLDALGIGFTLATHDLEIRGAGELLGNQQSGDIQELGFTLYMDLLSRTVTALKTGNKMDLETSLLDHGPEIDLHLSALIPESYIGDAQLRLLFYKRIAHTKQLSDLDEIQIEMIDRFGLLPEMLKNLIAIKEMKLKALDLGIVKIDANEKGGKLEFSSQPAVNSQKIIQLVQSQPQCFKLDGSTRLRFTLPAHELKERLALVNKLLIELSNE